MKPIFNKINIPDIDMDKIKKIPWILGSYAFSIILILILLDLILGEFLLYKYAILVKNEEPKVVGNTLRFEYNAYQKVLEEWQTREQKFEESTVEKYSNPFASESKNSIDLK